MHDEVVDHLGRVVYNLRMGTQESDRMTNLREDVNEAFIVLARYGVTESDAWEQATGLPLPMPAPDEILASQLQAMIDLSSYHQAVDEAGWDRKRTHIDFVAAFRMFTELTWQSGGKTHAGALFDEQYDAAAQGRAVQTVEQSPGADFSTLEDLAAQAAQAAQAQGHGPTDG